MKEDFYATIKLKTGEEIFTIVSADMELSDNLLVLLSPIKISVYENRNGKNTYKIEPWLKTTTEDMFIINLDDVVTMCENNDEEMIQMHQSFLSRISPNKNNSNLTREMGYICSVKDAKKMLEKIYKSN